MQMRDRGRCTVSSVDTCLRMEWAARDVKRQCELQEHIRAFTESLTTELNTLLGFSMDDPIKG